MFPIAAFDVSIYVPIVVALIASGAVGAVALYHARPRKDSIIAEAAEKAVDVVSKAIDRQATELGAARERIAVLEADLQTAALAHERCAVLERLLELATEAATELERRITVLRAEVTALGGNVEEINRVGKQGPPGKQGPRGEQGVRGV